MQRSFSSLFLVALLAFTQLQINQIDAWFVLLQFSFHFDLIKVGFPRKAHGQLQVNLIGDMRPGLGPWRKFHVVGNIQNTFFAHQNFES